MTRTLSVFAIAVVATLTILLVHGSRHGTAIAEAHVAEQSILPAVVTQPAPTPVERAHLTQPTRVSPAPLSDARRLVRWRHVLLVPKQCGANGVYDLVLHFHGAPDTMEPIFRASRLNAVVVITNLGLASGPYEKLFTGRQSFQMYLDAVTQELRASCGGAALRRVALSSWSAGYGAALRILEHQQNRERIDSVLLADGLHVGLERRYPRTVSAVSLEAVNSFAGRAARGQRLLAITHSEIATPSYASTTETASFLLNSQNVERKPTDAPGPRPAMRLRSTAHQADLWVSGYSGNNADAHCDHLYAFGKTLLPVLEARWER